LNFGQTIWDKSKAHFTLGVRANVQPQSSIPIGAKVEISPNGFTLRVKGQLEKNFLICPKLLINMLSFMALYWPQGWKKDTIEFGRPILQPLGPMFQHLLIS
jgi:hypothetical protein